MLKTLILLSFIFCLAVTGAAQLSFNFNDNIPVKIANDTLQNPWAGGLDYVQISDFDFDFDGDMDLFVFDRSRDNIRVFTQEIINGVPQWKIFHNAYLQFPTDIIYRATMVDFDFDGRKDLFTYGIGGLKVYRNTGDAVNGLQWTLFKEIINSDYNGFVSNLYVASSDIPALVDVDFDGDIDVLTFHQGGQHVEYHKNMSMENYGIPDSLDFVLANECWGKFSENMFNNSVTLNAQEVPCNGSILPNPQKNSAKHAGSTLLAMDIDNSGVMDLILGDVAYNNLVLLINGGTEPNQDSPMISLDNAFPSNSLPVDMYLFPAAFWVDVDFDGKKDLIVGANAKNVSENEKSIYFYKNTGTNQLPNFNFQTKSFLQNTMIDHGKGSIPVLFDYNNDGLTDLLVSNFYRFKTPVQKESTIAVYRNTGTATNPVFTYIDYDFLNLSQQNYGLRLVPAFGDLNGDGLSEMILGNEFGNLISFQNNGSTFVTVPGQLHVPDNHGAPISVGSFSFPQLFDLDKDGLLDLIVGNKTGEIAYYKNIGSTTVPNFLLVTANLGGIDVSNIGPDGYSAPHFFRMNDTTHLFVGDVGGKIHYYSNIDDSLASNGAFNLVSNNFLSLNFDGYSSVFVGDLDNDTFLNMFVGQDLGGVTAMEVDPNSSLDIIELPSKMLDAQLYPNPTNSLIYIQTFTSDNIEMRLFDAHGKIYNNTRFMNQFSLDMSNYANGIYFVQLTSSSGESVVKKIVKQ